MDEKRLSVLFVPGWYPSRVKPTLGNFIEKHAEAAHLFSDVGVIYACSDSVAAYEMQTEITHGVFRIVVYYKKVESKIPLLADVLKLIRYLRASRLAYKHYIAVKGKPDVVHLNFLLNAGLIALLLKWTQGIPFVYSEHWTGFLPSNLLYKPRSVYGKFYTWVANKSSQIMPVTKDLQHAMQQNGIKGNFKVVPNVVDTNLFLPIYESSTSAKEQLAPGNLNPMKVPHRKFRFIHISHLVDAHKNISGILRVVQRLQSIRTDFELLVISDGDLNYTRWYATELKLRDDLLRVEGTLSTAEVANRMGHSDCLVLFSNFENFPCVIPEAYSCGIPVISSKVGGIEEYVTDALGVLVPKGDETALFDAFVGMLDQRYTYSRERIRSYAVQEFSYEAIGKSFKDSYSMALQLTNVTTKSSN